MGLKREKIIEAAMKCFLERGYHASSTRYIAQMADVSEGLLFKHFVNKDGLMNAVLSRANDIIQNYYNDIIYETDPKKAIRKAIEFSFKMDQRDIERQYWHTLQNLKKELKLTDSSNHFALLTTLTINFTKLGFASPSLEAELMLHHMESFYDALSSGNVKDKQRMLQFLRSKYNV